MKDKPCVKYGFLIRRELTNFNRFKDYQNGYRRISNIRRHLGLSQRNWDDMVAGKDSIPLSIYKRTLKYLKKIRPMYDVELAQTNLAIKSFKKGLDNNKRINVF